MADGNGKKKKKKLGDQLSSFNQGASGPYKLPSALADTLTINDYAQSELQRLLGDLKIPKLPSNGTFATSDYFRNYADKVTSGDVAGALDMANNVGVNRAPIDVQPTPMSQMLGGFNSAPADATYVAPGYKGVDQQARNVNNNAPAQKQPQPNQPTSIEQGQRQNVPTVKIGGNEIPVSQLAHEDQVAHMKAQEVKDKSSALSSFAKALATPGFQKMLAQFGMALTAREPKSPGYVLSQQAAQNAEGQLANQYVGQLLAGKSPSDISLPVSPTTQAQGMDQYQQQQTIDTQKQQLSNSLYQEAIKGMKGEPIQKWQFDTGLQMALTRNWKQIMKIASSNVGGNVEQLQAMMTLYQQSGSAPDPYDVIRAAGLTPEQITQFNTQALSYAKQLGAQTVGSAETPSPEAPKQIVPDNAVSVQTVEDAKKVVVPQGQNMVPIVINGVLVYKDKDGNFYKQKQ